MADLVSCRAKSRTTEIDSMCRFTLLPCCISFYKQDILRPPMVHFPFTNETSAVSHVAFSFCKQDILRPPWHISFSGETSSVSACCIFPLQTNILRPPWYISFSQRDILRVQCCIFLLQARHTHTHTHTTLTTHWHTMFVSVTCGFAAFTESCCSPVLAPFQLSLFSD